MKAGRDLDALVAEKVMGLEVHGKYYQGEFFRLLIPSYSTDIGDAWNVVKTLDCVQITKYGNQYDCKVEGLPTVTAETVPLAICLAALRAVGVE